MIITSGFRVIFNFSWKKLRRGKLLMSGVLQFVTVFSFLFVVFELWRAKSRAISGGSCELYQYALPLATVTGLSILASLCCLYMNSKGQKSSTDIPLQDLSENHKLSNISTPLHRVFRSLNAARTNPEGQIVASAVAQHKASVLISVLHIFLNC